MWNAIQAGKGSDVLRGKGLRNKTISVLVIAILVFSSSVAIANGVKYTVKKGDTLTSIAARHRVKVKDLARANGISLKYVLPLGKTLVIPSYGKQDKTSTKSSIAQQSRSNVMHTAKNSVCLRSSASTSSSKITVLPKSTTVKLLAVKGQWNKVALSNGTTGYIYGSLLKDGVGNNTVQTTKTASQTINKDANTNLVQTALACRGTRYSRGGTSRSGFDCSGFTRYVYAKYGVSLPHSSAAQARLGTPVSKSELVPGDLVFFHTYRSGISHVGIYIGNNNFIHASTQRRGVIVDSLNHPYYSARYRGARHIKQN